MLTKEASAVVCDGKYRKCGDMSKRHNIYNIYIECEECETPVMRSSSRDSSEE